MLPQDSHASSGVSLVNGAWGSISRFFWPLSDEGLQQRITAVSTIDCFLLHQHRLQNPLDFGLIEHAV